MTRKIKISYTEDKLEKLFLNSEEMVKETNIEEKKDNNYRLEKGDAKEKSGPKSK